MEKETGHVLIKNINNEVKRKAMFVLKSRGKNLSIAVREMCEELADEFDTINK